VQRADLQDLVIDVKHQIRFFIFFLLKTPKKTINATRPIFKEKHEFKHLLKKKKNSF